MNSNLEEELDAWLQHLLTNHQYLSLDEILKLCSLAQLHLQTLPNILAVQCTKSTIIGSLRGYFLDFLDCIYTPFIEPKIHSGDHHFVFLGQYISRAAPNLQLLSLLLCLQLRYKCSISLIRGSTEWPYGPSATCLKEECISQYGEQGELVYCRFGEVFSAFPIAAVINEDIFCVHSGIPMPSMELSEIEELNQLNRFDPSVNSESLSKLGELIWHTPWDGDDWGMIGRGDIAFGSASTRAFLDKHNLSLLVRAHELVMDGYSFTHDDRLVTLYSCANFFEQIGNLGAIAEVGEDLKLSFHVFQESSRRPKRADLQVLH